MECTYRKNGIVRGVYSGSTPCMENVNGIVWELCGMAYNPGYCVLMYWNNKNTFDPLLRTNKNLE